MTILILHLLLRILQLNDENNIRINQMHTMELFTQLKSKFIELYDDEAMWVTALGFS
jgi:hypothetical protein